MSNPGLVGDADHPQPGREQFLDEVVLFVVERGAAEVGHAGGVHRGFVERALARLPHPLRDHRRRGVEVELLPLLCARRAVLHLRGPAGMRHQLEARRAFRTEMPARDGRLWITLDADDLPLAVVNELTTSHAAVRADRLGDFRRLVLRLQRFRAVAHDLRAGAVSAGAKLADEGPFEQQFGEHAGSVILIAGCGSRHCWPSSSRAWPRSPPPRSRPLSASAPTSPGSAISILRPARSRRTSGSGRTRRKPRTWTSSAPWGPGARRS